jgi:hypothetical protein
MDWKDLAGTLIKTGAPLIGTALGGPLGGTIGGFAGKLVADALGVEATPEAVSAAVAADPAGAADKLANADAQWQAMAEIAKADAADRTGQSQAINETIRAEASVVSWWHWRHLLGYVPVALGLEMAALLPAMALGYTKPDMVVAAIGALTTPLTVFAGLLGYVAQDTTKRHMVAQTGEPQPSISDSLVKTLGKVIGKKKIAAPAGSRD